MDLFERLVIARDMLVHHVAFPKGLAAELAIVGVQVREMDVLDVLIGGASVLEGLAAEPTAETHPPVNRRVTTLHVLRETGLGALYKRKENGAISEEKINPINERLQLKLRKMA